MTDSPAAQSAAEVPDDSEISKHSKAAVSFQRGADFTLKQQLFALTFLLIPKEQVFATLSCSCTAFIRILHNPETIWESSDNESFIS